MRKVNKKIQVFWVAIISSLAIFACADSYMGMDEVKIDGPKPDKITVNKVIPKSGAFEIHFTLPKGNANIAQIIASYINKRGEKVEFKVSRYTSSILVEGFTETDEITVELVCVDNNGNVSDITYVKDKPLISAVSLALQSMNIQPAFAGLRVDWKNPSGSLLAIHVLTKDKLNKYESALVEDPKKTIYTRDSLNTHAYIRSYAPIMQTFGFIVSDKWGNRSDTIIRDLTPFQEDQLDHKKVKELTAFNRSIFPGLRDYDAYGIDRVTGIQNDGNDHSVATRAKTLFDGNKAGQTFFIYKFVKNLASGDSEVVHSSYVTFDLNADLRLGRIKVFPRSNNHLTNTTPKRFRFWGTNDANPYRFTSFPETWTLIGEYVGIEPEDPDNWTANEKDYLINKQEYMAEEDNVNPKAKPLVSFRYLRIEFMETYNKNEVSYTTNEIELYGQIEKSY